MSQQDFSKLSSTKKKSKHTNIFFPEICLVNFDSL